MRKISFILFPIAALTFVACSGNAKIAQGNDASAAILTPNNLTSASVEISAETGGYVNLGSAQLKVPAQALDSDTEITAEITEIVLPEGGAKAIGKGIRFKPEGLQFLVPADLEICYGPNDAVNLNEAQAMIYYQAHNGQFVGIAGNVDVARRCVKGHIEHFSSYVAAAYAVSPGNTAPVFTGLNFLPTTPTPGVALRVRVQINDSNGGPTAGQVVAASLQYYFDSNAPQTAALQPDTTDDTVTNRYYFEIPANQVAGTTFNYAITAVDNLNATRRLPVAAGTYSTVAVGAPATAIRFNPAAFTAVSPLQISAGFSRQLALQVTADGTTWQNISAENVVALSSGVLGSLTRIAPSSVRFNAVGAGTGQIIATVGALTTSAYVNVAPGLLTHIEITDPNQVIISGTGNLAAGQTFDFDVIGFDSYGNIASVLPAFSTTGGIGSVTVDLTGAHFNAAPTVASGSIVATLAGLTDSISISLYIAPQVTATAPFDNTTGIAINSSIGVTFSQVMDTATLTTNTTSACTGSIQVSSDDFANCVPMVSAAPSFYASNTLALVQPAENLAGTTIYKIRVTASVRNTLSQPLVANYTTPAGFTTVSATPPSGSNSAIGVLDPTFSGGQFTRLNARPISAIVEASGSIYVVGSVLDVTATPPSQMLVYKLDSSGSPVSSFGTGGIVYANPALESWGTSLAFNAAGTKLLVGGVRRDAGGVKLLTVWQINLPDGSMDMTFGPNGDGSFSLPDTSDASEDLMQILVDLSSNVFATGKSSLGMTVFKLSSAGLLDGSFTGSGVFSTSNTQSRATMIRRSNDNRLLVVGDDTSGGITSLTIWKLTLSGILDTTFNGTGVFHYTVPGEQSYGFNLVQNSSGQIYASAYGPFTPGASTFVIRMSSTGIFDVGFAGSGVLSLSSPVGHTGSFFAPGLLLDANEKLVISGGSLNTSTSVVDATVWQYNPDGSLDSTFGTNGAVTVPPPAGFASIAVQPARDATGRLIVPAWRTAGSLVDFLVVRLN